MFKLLLFGFLSVLALPRANAASLTITAPASGTSYAPGDTVAVTVTSTDSALTLVGLSAASPLSYLDFQSGSGPYHFSLTLPATLPPGTYGVIAFGSPGHGGGITAVSAAISISVERTDAPSKIRVSPASLDLPYIGATRQLAVSGIFAAGTYTVSNSSSLSITSSNPGVVTVTGTTVTAAGPGSTNLTVQYGAAPSISVLVTVTAGTPPVACTFTVSPGQSAFSAGGGSSAVSITASAPSCSWTAASGASWLIITPPTIGAGSGALAFSVGTNVSANGRSAMLTVAGRSFTITQPGSACTYTVSTPASPVYSSASTGSITVTAAAGCSWTAASDSTWLSITAGATGSANGTVAYSIAANPDVASRTANLTVAGQTFQVVQNSSSCTYSAGFSLSNLPAAAGAGTASVTAPAACSWTASSDASWFTITSGASGSGNGGFNFSVAANNTSTSRTANVTVGTQTVVITQAGISCSYTIGFASTNMPSAGATGTATVSAPAGCSWTPSSNAGWFTIPPASGGSGSGSFNFSAAANTGTSSRSATVTVATASVTITQAGLSCSYLIGSAGIGAPPSGGVGSVGVSASDPSCSWTATSNAAWLTVSSGASGTGGGTVGFTVLANPNTSTRTGTLTIAGQTFTVTQTGIPGSVTLVPTQVTVPASGGTGSFTVTANAPDFAWTAGSNATWLTITSGPGGTGSGTVAWSATANNAPGVRTATITVASQTVTFTQNSTTGGPYAFATNVWADTTDAIGVIDTSSATLVGLAQTHSGTPAFCQAGGWGSDHCFFTHAVTVKPDGTQAWAANNFAQEVAVVDTAAHVVTNISIPGNPRGVAFLPDGSRAYVVNETGQVAIVDTATYTVLRTIDLTLVEPYSTYPPGSGPFFMNIVISQDGRRAYMSDVGGWLVVMDIATDKLVTRIPSFVAPYSYSTAQWVALSPDGTRAFLTDSGTQQAVLIIDTGLNQILGKVSLGGTPRGIAVTLDGKKLYVANDSGNYVSVVDVATQTLLKNIPIGGSRGVAIAPNGNVWATRGGSDRFSDPGRVLEIDTTTDQIVRTVSFPASPGYCCLVQIDVQHPAAPNRLSNSIVNASGAGGSGTITIGAALPSFNWTATTTAGWLTINSPASGTGTGTIGFTAQPNYGEAAREALVQIGNLVAIVVQGPVPYIISTLAGASPPLSTPASSFTPYIISMAVSPAGHLFAGAIPGAIYDVSGGNAVRYAGSGIEGPAGDGGPAANAQIGEPWGLAFDSAGNLYIADATDESIRKVDASTKTITTIAGGHSWGYQGDGGPATLAKLSNVRGLAVDSSGNIYVGDVSNYRVRKIDAATGNISTVAGNGSPSLLGQITGLALDGSGNLYIADGDHYRIWKATPGGSMSSVAGAGYSGFTADGAVASNSPISRPDSVVVDSHGNVYFNEGNRVRMVSAGTGLLSTVAGAGNYSDDGDGGPARSAGLQYAMTLAVDAAGNVYIGHGNDTRVRMVNAATGIISTVLGPNAVPDNVPANTAILTDPPAVAVDDSGNVYYADTHQHRVRKVDAATGRVTTVAGTGVAGFGFVGPAASSQISFPSAVAVDGAGNLYIAHGASIQRLDANTGLITTVAGGSGGGFNGDNGPATSAQLSYQLPGLAIDGNGNLFVADMGNGRIRKINLATSIITTVAGNGSSGFSGDNGPATGARFNSIIGLSADARGNLFVCDAGNFRVRRVDAATGIVTTIAGSTWGEVGNDGPANAAQFEVPAGCAVDESGNLFIGDRSTNRIRKISGATGYVRAVAGIGIPGASGDGGPALDATLDGPIGIAVQRNGNLYVADNGSARVRKLALPAAQCAYTLNQSKATLPAGGGGSSVTLTTSAGCSWTAASNSSWITITSAVSGTGSATVNYTAGSTAAVRYGSLTIAGQRLSVTEGGAALSIAKTHTGNFTQGQPGVAYTITVSNGASAQPTTGPVTVSEQLPAALTLVSLSGTGWNCQVYSSYCTRSDVLSPGSSYPPITAIANVASNAPSQVTNVAAVSGGGSPGAAVSDATTIAPPPSPYIISRVAGLPPASGVQAAGLPVFSPGSIAGDASGNLYIGSNQRVIYKVAPSGQATIIAGSGSDGYSGDGGPATSAMLSSYIGGIATDPAGNIYFTDTWISRVRKIATNGTITTIGGGPTGFGGDGGLATNAFVNGPQYLARDTAGNLYFWDSNNNRIRRIDTSGIINTIAGTGAVSSGPDGPGTGVPLNAVEGLAVAPGGDLYIAERGGQKIRTWNPGTGQITTVAGTGNGGYSPDGTAALSANLSNPRNLCFDSLGVLHFLDGNRIRKIVSGNLVTVAGNGNYDFTGDGGPPLAAALLYPQGLAFDSSGSLYLLERNDNRVRKIAGGTISTFIGGNSVGDGGSALSSNLVETTRVAVDSKGNVYIADQLGQRVRKVASGTGIITTLAGTGIAGFTGDGGPASAAQINYPTGVAVDAGGNVYIAAGLRIRKVAAATGTITTIAGNGNYGSTGDGGSALQATFGYQLGIAVDGSGNIYVADGDAHRVRRISAVTGTITSFAGSGAGGFSGDGGPAVNAAMGYVWSLAADTTGNVYIADSENLRLRKVDAGTGIINTIAGTGTWGYAGDFGPASQAQLPYFLGVAADAFGNVYIGGNDARVRKISAAGIITTIAGTGNQGYSGDGGSALQANLDFPDGIAISREGIVYLADRGNSRVRKLAPPALSPALSLTKTHTGSFVPGQNGAVYTLTVSNSAAASSASGTVTVTETLPAGLTLGAMTGAGWTCVSNSCTRSDALPAGGTYPPITVTVNVAANAGSPLINQASVSGGGSTPDTASDSTVLGANAPLLSIVSAHTGSFNQGQNGAAYTVTVSNASGKGPTSGTVTVAETVPTGMTLVSMAGTGWLCSSNTCTRSDALNGGSSYPAIVVTVKVAANAGTPLTNLVSVSGGGSAVANASDPTTILITNPISSPALHFIPLTPCRVADTRNASGPFGGPPIAGGTTRNFAIPTSACAVPANALAYSLNVAVVPAGPLGYVTVWPAGQSQPLVSTLNSLDGRVKSNAAVVPAGDGGAVSVFASNATQVILDINGYFVLASDPAALAFFPVAPCRVADTRQTAGPMAGPSLSGGQIRSFPVLSASSCNIPASARAYSLNLAAVPKGPLGYVTAWATGQSQPLVASLNALTGTVTANAAIVPAGIGGAIDLFASNATDLVIDVNGYFAPAAAGGLSLYNVAPCRVEDTRQPSGTPAFTGQRDVAVSASVCGIPAAAQAHVVAAAVVPSGALGYLTLWPQGQPRPGVATLNALDGAVTSNLAIVPTTNGSISAFASNSTHLVLDVFGYFGQ